MAPQKRKQFHTDPAEEAVHPSRAGQVPGAIPKLPSHKKPRNSNGANKYHKQQHDSSVNAIKKRIRDVSRKLEYSAESLPADVRAEEERALETYKQELEDAEQEKLKAKMISRYHMVRFFERKKSERMIKRIRKEILAAPSIAEVERLNKELHIAEVDLNYTQYSPLNEIYIGLYPQKLTKDIEDREDAKKAKETTEENDSSVKPPMWAEVEKAMKDGTLDKLRNRKAEIIPKSITHPQQQNHNQSASKSSKQHQQQAARSSSPNLGNLTLQPKSRLKPEVKQASQPEIDTTGLNRAERRRLERGEDRPKKPKNRSMGFMKNQEFGAQMAAQRYEARKEGDGEDSDGGFFED